jgi:hypothetical protein
VAAAAGAQHTAVITAAISISHFPSHPLLDSNIFQGLSVEQEATQLTTVLATLESIYG